MKKIENLDDELGELSPFLREMKQKDTGLRVPEHYFESLEKSVFDNIDAIGARRKTAQKESWWHKVMAFGTLFRRPRYAFALAGLLCFSAAAWWLLQPSQTDDIATAQYATVEISEQEAEAYILANVQEFEPTQLAPEHAEDIPSPMRESVEDDPGLEQKHIDDLLQELSDEELEELL